MINFSPVVRPIICSRAHGQLRAHPDVEAVQRNMLKWLLKKARSTSVGQRYGYGEIMSAADFADRVPLHGYPDLRADIMAMVHGEKNVLWPGRCCRFAQSSGTTDGKSKYIPITEDSLSHNHYRGGIYASAFYLDAHPHSRLFGGKAFILGGSFANEVEHLNKGVKVGDLSAHLIDHINPAVERLRVPSRQTALMQEWHEKLPLLISESLHEDITSISGVPSWFLTVLRGVIAKAGAATIHDVWPNLEVFFHGGISFAPYREQYAEITDPSKMHYLETYNASEGFFGVQDDPSVSAMLLMINDGVYYEFIPMNEVDKDHPQAVPAWETTAGEVYELLITSCNGLWRYRIGDTVKVESTSPLRISIAGRTKQYINAFGEELMVHNADEAMSRTCADTGAKVSNYSAAPVYTTSKSRGCHQWLIEFEREPEDLEQFAFILDKHLQQVNSDYQAKRTDDIFLSGPLITVAEKGLFDRWLATRGKLGGQRKIPRLSPDREVMESMLSMNIKP